MLELKSLSDVQTKVLDLQGQILAAQGSALDAQAEHLDLKNKLAELEQLLRQLRYWEEEKLRYSLSEVSPGVFVRAVKDEFRDGDPLHWLCCNCFDRGEKAILQFAFEGNSARVYKCHRCESEIAVNSNRVLPPSRSTGDSWKTS